jgi:alpha-mannosidase
MIEKEAKEADKLYLQEKQRREKEIQSLLQE